GRGVMAEVGAKLVGQFADCLATQIGAGSVGPAAAAEATATTEPERASSEPADAAEGAVPAEEAAAAAPPPDAVMSAPPPPERLVEPQPRPTADAIDLIDTAGGPVLKRVLPVAAVLVVALVVWRLLRKRRH